MAETYNKTNEKTLSPIAPFLGSQADLRPLRAHISLTGERRHGHPRTHHSA